MMGEMIHIVQQLGAKLLGWKEESIFSGAWVGSQYKADVDKMAHEFLCQELTILDPSIDIISEEDIATQKTERPDRYWLIDPIDGTASFVSNFAGFVTQIALIESNQPQLAAIYAPMLQELYVAERGRGAYCNGKMLSCKGRKSISTLIDNYPTPQGIAASLYRDLKFIQYVECGSISLKICKIAQGVADVFCKDVEVKDWDIAAPQLVLQEAGGALCDISGASISYSGDFAHKGIVAAHSSVVGSIITSWYAALNSTDGKIIANIEREG